MIYYGISYNMVYGMMIYLFQTASEHVVRYYTAK